MSPKGTIALQLALLASIATLGISADTGHSRSQTNTVAAGQTFVMMIPDDYAQPPDGWLPVCNADRAVCAYHARKGAEALVVANGKPGPPYEDVRNIALSRGGRVAYEARRKGGWVVVVDGHEGPAFDRIDELNFRGETVAYIGQRGERRRLVVGDRMSEEVSDFADFAVSPDGKSYAYVITRIQTMVSLSELHRNGKYYWEDNLISNISFTHDGRLVFASRTGTALKGRSKLMLDDEVMSEHNEVLAAIAVSPDGHRFAPVGCMGAAAQRRCVLTLDRKAVREAAAIQHPAFSPDGRTLAYAERQAGGRWHVVVGDRTEPEVDAILSSVVFSPDGKRHAYPVRIGANVALLADGVVGPPFDGIEAVVFSADSNHFAYAASKADGQSIVLDHVPGRAFTWVSAPGFDAAGKMLMFVAQDGRRFSRLSVAVGARPANAGQPE